jgi:hypothetical protein
LDPASGDISVGSTVYKGTNPGFHVLVISRAVVPGRLNAPQILLDQSYTDSASVNSALQNITQTYLNPTPMVIVNAVGNYAFPISAVADALAKFGADGDLAPIIFTAPLTFIGTGGANPKTARQRGYGSREISGYLATDSNNNYAFIQTDYVHYDIGVDGTITVGKKQYQAADAGYKVSCDAAASDSFHLLVVDRESPDSVLFDNVYCTGQHPENLNTMAGDVSTLNNEGQLIFIATNGHPIPADWNFNTGGDLRGLALARQIVRLGGYYETIMYLSPTDTYSLVTAPPPPPGTPHASDRAREFSSVYVDGPKAIQPTGELHGVLARGRGNWYSPLNADPSGVANLGLYDILAQTPIPFPHPVGSDEMSAFQYINQTLCGSITCNMRNAYTNQAIDIDSTYTTPLTAMTKDQSGNDCTDKANSGLPYCVVRAQLLIELKDVSNLRAFYKNVTDLWLAGGTTNILSLLTAYDTVKATIPVLPTAQAPSLVRPLVGFFLGLAGNIPLVGQAFGLADTAFNLGMDLTTDKQGNKTVDLTSTIATVEDQALDHFKAQAITTATTLSMVYQDWGKLDALGSALLRGSTDSSSPWFWRPETTGQMLQHMDAPVKVAAYQNIMTAAYAIGRYVPGSPLNCSGNGPWPVWGGLPLYNQPWAYTVLDLDFTGCGIGGGRSVQPFNSSVGYVPYTFPNDPNNPWAKDLRTATIMADASWLGISLQTSPYNSGPNGAYNPPGASLLTELFKPVADGGLGVYRPAFFEGWPFPHLNCDYSSGVYPPGQPGAANGGCAWNSGSTPVSSSPPGPANFSIRATQISSDQTRATVLLKVHNNGSESANAIELTSISLRTLAGSGEATVVSPSLPAIINGLAPGDSTDVMVTLNIPAGVTKLSVTEQGTADLGQPEPTRFSGGEVLYPAR